MIYHKVFTAGKLNLEFKKGYPVVNHEFEILNDDCTAKDFSDVDGVYFKLFAKQGGKLLHTIDMMSGDNSPDDNFIYLNDDVITSQERAPRECYHECYAVSGSPEVSELLFYGISLIEP